MDTREREREKRMRTTTTTEKQKYQRLQVARQVCRDIETIRHHFLSPDLMSSDSFSPISTYIIYIVRFSFDDMFFSSKATHTTWNNSLINRNQTHYVPFSTIIRLQFIDSSFNQEAECNMHFASPHPLLILYAGVKQCTCRFRDLWLCLLVCLQFTLLCSPSLSFGLSLSFLLLLLCGCTLCF